MPDGFRQGATKGKVTENDEGYYYYNQSKEGDQYDSFPVHGFPGR